MAAAIKAVLAIVLVAAFCTLDGVDGIQCYKCNTGKDAFGVKCNDKYKETDTCRGKFCYKQTEKEGGVIGVHRDCISEDAALHGVKVACESNPRGDTCVCDKNLCNSVGYLYLTPLYAFGLVLLTAVWNLGCQLLN